MDIDKNSLYYQHISNRSFLHFIIGLYPRLIRIMFCEKSCFPIVTFFMFNQNV